MSEVIPMTTTIAMPSLTHAMKGQKVLQAAGFHTQVHKLKQVTAQGCGYSLQVQAEAAPVLQLLERSAVPLLRFTEE